MKKLSLLLVLVMGTIFAMAQNGRIDLRQETKLKSRTATSIRSVPLSATAQLRA